MDCMRTHKQITLELAHIKLLQMPSFPTIEGGKDGDEPDAKGESEPGQDCPVVCADLLTPKSGPEAETHGEQRQRKGDGRPYEQNMGVRSDLAFWDHFEIQCEGQ